MRDAILKAIAVGVQEALEEDYLRYRIASTAYLGDHIAAAGVPIVQPPGGHAIYLDARAFLPHIPADQFPGVALCCELYLEGGVRSVEIGTLMFAGSAQMDLVRLAIPRRVYTQSHIDYLIEVILEVWKNREQISGMRLTYEAPFLRHFTAHLEPCCKCKLSVVSEELPVRAPTHPEIQRSLGLSRHIPNVFSEKIPTSKFGATKNA